jgi:putative ABC transport system ATP-binding protein
MAQNAIEVQQAVFGPNGMFRIPKFELKSNEKVLLMGPSGCGKTSFLEFLAGFREGTATKLAVASHSVVFQDLNLVEEFSLRENLDLELDTASAESGLQTLAALDLKLSPKSLVKTMSKGEQQRLAVVRALGKHSTLILADEPTSHLDRLRADRVMEMIVKSSRAALIVSHDTHLERFFDRVIDFEGLTK